MLTDDQIASVAHAANRAYCHAVGDDSQAPWAQAPQWQRDSAITGVRHVRDNPYAPPSAAHDSWLSQKEADGWRYGATKNAELKEHPTNVCGCSSVKKSSCRSW